MSIHKLLVIYKMLTTRIFRIFNILKLRNKLFSVFFVIYAGNGDWWLKGAPGRGNNWLQFLIGSLYLPVILRGSQ